MTVATQTTAAASGARVSLWLTGEATLLVLPNIDAANISYNLLKVAAAADLIEPAAVPAFLARMRRAGLVPGMVLSTCDRTAIRTVPVPGNGFKRMTRSCRSASPGK